jgi:hypothetical protein
MVLGQKSGALISRSTVEPAVLYSIPVFACCSMLERWNLLQQLHLLHPLQYAIFTVF